MDPAHTSWPLIGHTALLRTLRQLLESDVVPDALLFTGADGVGKRTTGMLVQQTLLCRGREHGASSPCHQCVACKQFLQGAHPDAFVLAPIDDQSFLGIEQIRALHRFLMLQPALGTTRTALIDAADRLTDEAANALLKLLEEPPASTYLLLITSRPDALPGTVRSRCAELHFAPVSTDELTEALRARGCPEERARELAQYAFGSPGVALPLADQPEDFARVRTELREIAALLTAPIPERLRAVHAWVGKRNHRDAAARAAETVEAVRWMFRDALLLHWQSHPFIRFRFLHDQLLRLTHAVSVETLLRASRLAEEAARALRKNVHPQLLLEHIFLHL